MTGMLLVTGAGGLVRIPGSTPAGGLITPVVVPPGIGVPSAGGAIFSGGVGEVGGVGPGGAVVADGGLDGCALATPKIGVTASKMAVAAPAKRRESLVSSVFMPGERRRAPWVSWCPANVSAAHLTIDVSSNAQTRAVSDSSAKGLAITSSPGDSAMSSSAVPA